MFNGHVGMDDIKSMPTDMRFQYMEYVSDQYKKRNEQYDKIEQDINQRRNNDQNRRMVKPPYKFN